MNYEDDGLDMERRRREASMPDSLKGLRACIPCMLIKTMDQFYHEGCENCVVLELKDDMRRCEDFTTGNFEGLIALADPGKSWVARWQRCDRLVSGCYAVKCFGQLSAESEQVLEEENIRNLGKLSLEEN